MFDQPDIQVRSPQTMPAWRRRRHGIFITRLEALANLRAFTAQPTNYYKCPLTRRAAVLILLFADRAGDLRVVLTIRSANLKNYSGQAALPGGKADTLQETPFHTARREAFEEIGLAMRDDKLPVGYEVEHLTELPTNLAMTELGVRPCVAYLKTPAPSAQNRNPDASRDLLPKLDAKEVAAVFTAPFFNFLRTHDLDPTIRRTVPGEWYKGSWHSWHESAWRMHQFFVPVTPSTVFLANTTPPTSTPTPPPTTPSRKISAPAPETTAASMPPHSTAEGAASLPGKPSQPQSQSQSQSTLQPPLPPPFYHNPPSALSQPRYRVFGMTARILVDCARVAYGEEPEFEHNSHFGDEEMIERLLAIGRLAERRREGEMLTREVMVRAAGAKI
ncbi:hypothetical protein BAUCODRAFT_542582 [Baudoinia panamericana UAMH 10762]|uniref:Nudix hydrolase domain-containing protein n=1 Tax=Baudoinia panamericana (strain UAMH 10762) TaxID=717646 RepID=M2LMC7_BAUPA|nr:uncharacterized protein BAUCODRAFT_542582 [Baudoinia panamericana UAMH 10762]EMC95467.1 hypothetical protein BAUCODRAFT_542582 [Baudoinia panamericana UAMH 10762]